MNRPLCDENRDEVDLITNNEERRKVRRSKPKKKNFEDIVLMYANIQGFTGKKTSLEHIIETTQADIILLAETMTRMVELKGCKSIYPKRSVGQNVGALLSGKVCSYQK